VGRSDVPSKHMTFGRTRDRVLKDSPKSSMNFLCSSNDSSGDSLILTSVQKSLNADNVRVRGL
jgi:hypothetical protein